MKRIALVLSLLLPAGAAEPDLLPEALLPPETAAFWTAPSLPALRDALTASPLLAGALDGSWASAGEGLLKNAGIPEATTEPVLWDWIGRAAPEFPGAVALAWVGDAPVALGRVREEASRHRILEAMRREALLRGLKLEEGRTADGPWASCAALRVHVGFSGDWCFAARDAEAVAALGRVSKAPPERSLASEPAFREARAGAQGQAFLYLSPGRLLGRERSPFGRALGWSCAFSPEGVKDRIRLHRPGRRALLDPRPCRLAGALPKDAAVRLAGRFSGPRLRSLLADLLGQDLSDEDPLAASLASWEGEVAVAFRWMFILPDVLLGFEAADPAGAEKRLVAWIEGRGARRLSGGGWALPGWDTPFVIRPGEGAVWIGTNPQAAADAASVKPADGAAGIRAEVRFPEVLGPLTAAAGLQPEGSPLRRLLEAKALCTAALTEDAGGLLLTADTPCGLQPLAAALLLAFQALDAHPVAEPPEEVAARVRRALPAARSLAFKTPLDVRVVSPEESVAEISRQMLKELPPERLGPQQEALRAFGLLSRDQDLGRILTGPFAHLVGGFYVPEDKALYLIRGMPAQEVIAAHEMTHALQDQHHDLKTAQESFRKGPNDSDRESAFTALVEGDATHLMETFLQGGAQASPAAGLRILLETAAAPELLLAQARAMLDMPPALLRMITFPYEDGKAFVAGVRKARGWAGVDAMFANPPVSTEQILHPEKYEGPGKDLPATVSVEDLVKGAGEGWTAVWEDVMGELGAQCVLRRALGSGAAAKAAAGWDGDRYALLSKGPARLLLWRSVWDSEDEAKEFEAALVTAWAGRSARIVREGARVEASVTLP